MITKFVADGRGQAYSDWLAEEAQLRDDSSTKKQAEAAERRRRELRLIERELEIAIEALDQQIGTGVSRKQLPGAWMVQAMQRLAGKAALRVKARLR